MRRRFLPRSRQQAHTLWTIVGTVLCLIAGWQGVGYAFNGDHVANTPSYYVLKALLPGGMYLHGALLIALAAGMGYVLVTPFDRRSKWILRTFAFYCFLIGLSIVGSWVETGEIVWGGPVVWLGLGLLAEGMVTHPPDALPITEEESRASRDLVASGNGLHY